MEEKTKFIQLIKEHKKELIFAGITTGTIIAIILGVKNKEQLAKEYDLIYQKLKQFLSNPSDNSFSIVIKEGVVNESLDKNNTLIKVSPHIRNLHEGWSASTNKIETALEHGFCLKEGQTWVDSYKKEYLVV